MIPSSFGGGWLLTVETLILVQNALFQICLIFLCFLLQRVLKQIRLRAEPSFSSWRQSLRPYDKQSLTTCPSSSLAVILFICHNPVVPKLTGLAAQQGGGEGNWAPRAAGWHAHMHMQPLHEWWASAHTCSLTCLSGGLVYTHASVHQPSTHTTRAICAWAVASHLNGPISNRPRPASGL